MAAALAISVVVCGRIGFAAEVEPGGAHLYRQYCASCHGVDGKGKGPVAAELRHTPTDLTRLKQRYRGRLDIGALMAIIDGRRVVAAHGPREMPVWGAIFSADLKDKPYSEYTTLLHSKALAEYIETIQEH